MTRRCSLSCQSSLLKLTPAIVEKVWGGNRLKNIHGTLVDGPVGETWEISNHPDGESSFCGEKLSKIVDENQLSYLVKFIDTSDNLSVQVHPNDKFAMEHENSSGKTECWMVLDAGKNSEIFLGLKNGVTKELFEKALKNKDDMSEYLESFRPKRGDFFFVPAGTVHAIGKNVFLVEVQQSSGITYRVWDWNRVDDNGNSRELHVDKALKVIRYGDDFNNHDNFMVQHGLFEQNGSMQIVEHDQFRVTIHHLQQDETCEIDLGNNKRACGIVCLDGEMIFKRGDETVELMNYQSLLALPEGDDLLKIRSARESRFIQIN